MINLYIITTRFAHIHFLSKYCRPKSICLENIFQQDNASVSSIVHSVSITFRKVSNNYFKYLVLEKFQLAVNILLTIK